MSLASLFRRAPRRFMTPGQLAAHLGPASTASAPSTAKPTPSPTPSDADEPTPGHPVVHPDLTREWPEMTPDVLRRVLGDKAVEVELGRRGRGYLDPGWQRVEMPFSFFLDYISKPGNGEASDSSSSLGGASSSDASPPPSSTAHAAQPSPPSAHFPHNAPNAPSHPTEQSSDATATSMHLSAYLAQLPLPESLPLPPLPHYTALKGDLYGRTLWVGNASFTPFHRDPNHGIYTHLFGEKVFYLVPPQNEAHLAPAAGILRNTSRVPVPVSCLDAGEEMPDLEHDPEVYRGMIRRAADGGYTARLAAGDSLLIPMGWWHSAEGLGLGIGVNAWFR